MPLFIFILASIMCSIGMVACAARYRENNRDKTHLFSAIILAYISLIYSLAAFSLAGLIEPLSILKNGSLTSTGVFFMAMLIAINAYLSRSRKHGC